MRPTVKLTVGGAAMQKQLIASLAALQKKAVYVGIPTTTAMDRKRQLMSIASRSGKHRSSRIQQQAVVSGVNNAELLYIHSNGSPLRNIPRRPVIEPALEDSQNQRLIEPELRAACEATLDGKKDEALQHLDRAALLGQNAARGWFTSSKNGWAPNAPSTIRAKGSSRPLIDTSAMRNAIVGFVADDK